MEQGHSQVLQADEDALAGVLQYLNTLAQRLELYSLSPGQRSALPKLHQGHTAFVAEIRNICLKHKAFLPVVFDLNEFHQAVTLADNLRRLQTELVRLRTRISDALLAVEGDNYINALEAYGYLQMIDGESELVAACRQLRQFFRRNRDCLNLDPEVYN